MSDGGASRWRRRAFGAIPIAAATVVVLGGDSLAGAQDPVPVTKARYHRVTFENDIVRVIHVEMPPGTATDDHEHTLDSVAIVLTPASVTLQPAGGAATAATFSTGAAIYTPAPMPYTHRVGNAGSDDVRLLTIELKHRASRPDARAPTPPPGLLLDNDRVSARRVSLAPGESATALDGPAMRVFVTGGSITERGRRTTVTSGLAVWTPMRERSTTTNAGDAPLSYVEVALK